MTSVKLCKWHFIPSQKWARFRTDSLVPECRQKCTLSSYSRLNANVPHAHIFQNKWLISDLSHLKVFRVGTLFCSVKLLMAAIPRMLCSFQWLGIILYSHFLLNYQDAMSSASWQLLFFCLIILQLIQLWTIKSMN